MITVYVSTTSSPSTSRSDAEIDLSAGATLPQNVQLYAEAVDTSDAGATFTFSWHLLRKPTGSAAALSDPLLANPVLNSVDVWGNYLLYCIATNVATSEKSERDPLQSGASAFVKVFVRSERLGLVKPAPSERDWFERSWEWVDAIEAMDAVSDDHETRITDLEAATPTTALADLTDVNLSSPSAGESLVYDGVEWVNQMVSGGGGSSTLTVNAESGITSGTVALSTEAISFTGSDGVIATGSTPAGKFNIDISLASVLAVDISGNAATATDANAALLAVQATYANQFVSPNTLNLTGPITGTAQIGTATTTVNLATTIGAGQVLNANIANPNINFTDGTNTSAVALGGSLTIQGTANEADVAYSSGTNTFTVGLPASINANAATATALQTSRTISLTGGATGSASFNGTANAAIATTLATATTAVRGGVLLDQGTAYGNSSAYILNRERVVLNGFVDNTHFENTATSNHASDDDGISETSSSASNLIMHSVCIFRNPFKTTAHIDNFSAVIGDSGVEGGDGYYLVELVKYENLAAVRSGTYTTTGETLTLTSDGDHEAGADFADYSTELTGPTLASGAYIGVIIANSPKYLGHALHIQMTVSRAVGDGAY